MQRSQCSIILWAEQNTRYQNRSTKFESGFLDATITMFYNIVGRTEYKKISESFYQVRKSFSRRNDHNVRLTRMPSARVRFHEIIHRRLHDARYNNKCMQFLLLNHDTAAALHLTKSFGFLNNLFTHNIRTVLYSSRASDLRHGSLSS
jgi:hypothetical protein